jgi:hypothetical protein
MGNDISFGTRITNLVLGMLEHFLPRKRWINAVEIDSREILKVRNWKRESQDRQVWRRHLKEAKA